MQSFSHEPAEMKTLSQPLSLPLSNRAILDKVGDKVGGKGLESQFWDRRYVLT
jgi:hypothetical protein